MNDDSNKIQDLFGLTSISDIQLEIERDLENSSATETELPSISIDTIHSDWFDAPVTGGFYRETVKSPLPAPRAYNPWFKRAVAIFLVATLGMGSLGFGIGAGIGFFTRQDNTTTVGTNGEPANDATFTSTSPSFTDITEQTGTLADIVEALQDAVVTITARPAQNPSLTERHGSGIIFAEDDTRIFIVTNYYIVRGGGDRFDVRIAGGRTVDGRPVGMDSTADIAVLYVEKSLLLEVGIDTVVIATFGDSDQMRVGDTVLAIGNAMGGGNAVTRGVLSSASQTVVLPAGGHTLPLLQTDAAINYGNSGGPLINTRGEVIGININQASNLIFGVTNVEGISFSIASNIVVPLLEDLIHGRRPALGIMGSSVSEAMAAELDIPPLGVFVSNVVPGRAAYRGGMLDGDIITGFNGQPVFNWQQLVYAIRASQIGEAVEVRVLRYGTTAITLYIELDVMVVESF